MKKLFDDFFAFWGNFFALLEYGYFSSILQNYGSIFSEMGGIMGYIFEPELAPPHLKLPSLVNHRDLIK